jgi:hypothetical protein
LRIEYSSLRITTNTIGSRCWAAVYIACTEYWQEPSPMVGAPGSILHHQNWPQFGVVGAPLKRSVTQAMLRSPST